MSDIIRELRGNPCYDDTLHERAADEIGRLQSVIEDAVHCLQAGKTPSQRALEDALQTKGAGRSPDDYDPRNDDELPEGLRDPQETLHRGREVLRRDSILRTILEWCEGNIKSGSQVAPFCVQVRDLIESGNTSNFQKTEVSGTFCINCGDRLGLQGFYDSGDHYCCASCFDECATEKNS